MNTKGWLINIRGISLSEKAPQNFPFEVHSAKFSPGMVISSMLICLGFSFDLGRGNLGKKLFFTLHLFMSPNCVAWILEGKIIFQLTRIVSQSEWNLGFCLALQSAPTTPRKT